MACWILGIGLALGILSALALRPVLASVLYEVSPRDPATLLTSTLFLAAVGLLATYLPPRRATRVDPMVARSAE
jgi:ABC-type antimicrobial peptide transport system permease subunit